MERRFGQGRKKSEYNGITHFEGFYPLENMSIFPVIIFRKWVIPPNSLSKSEYFRCTHFPKVSISSVLSFQKWVFPLYSLSKSEYFLCTQFPKWVFPLYSLSKSEYFLCTQLPKVSISAVLTLWKWVFPLYSLLILSISSELTYRKWVLLNTQLFYSTKYKKVSISVVQCTSS